jgi:hypothetical protein
LARKAPGTPDGCGHELRYFRCTGVSASTLTHHFNVLREVGKIVVTVTSEDVTAQRR